MARERVPMIGGQHRPVALALALYLVLWHGYFFTIGYRVTADDVAFLEILLRGPEEAFRFSASIAADQGRIGFYILMPLNMVGSWISSFALGRVLSVALYFSIAALFAIYAARLLRAPVALLLFLVWLALHPLAFEHMPPVAYSLQNTVPFLIVLGCRLQRLAAMDAPQPSPVSHHVIIYGPLLIAMLSTEYAALLAIALIGGEWLIRIEPFLRRRSPLEALRVLARKTETAWEAGAIILTLTIYIGYRLFNPSRYDGNSMDGLWSLARLAETTIRHILAGTTMPRVNIADLAQVPAGGIAASIAAGVILAATVTIELRRISPVRVRVLPVLAYVAVAVVVVTFPISAAQKYQAWCVDAGICGFLDSRTSYLGVALALGLGAAAVASRVPDGRLRLVAILGLSSMAGVAFTLTSLHNWRVSQEMEKFAAVWNRADLMHCFPETSLAPELLPSLADPDRRIPRHSRSEEEAFWKLYVANAHVWSDCPTGEARKEAEADVRSLFPYISPGATVGLPGIGRFLGTGWSTIEPWQVWSDGPAATLFLMPQGIELGQPAFLALEFGVYFDDELTRQDVEIRSDGRVLWRRQFYHTGAIDCCRAVVPLVGYLTDTKPIRLDLHIAHPKQPGRGGADPRRLGVGLRELSLVAEEGY